MATRWLTHEEVLEMHRDLIADHGGSLGLRDAGLLDSALAMPAAGFGGSSLHADEFEKAAAYLFHLVKNHPFIDGNKRIGLASALVFLDLNGWPCTAENEALVELTLSVAEGRTDKPKLAAFFRAHTRKRRRSSKS